MSMIMTAQITGGHDIQFQDERIRPAASGEKHDWLEVPITVKGKVVGCIQRELAPLCLWTLDEKAEKFFDDILPDARWSPRKWFHDFQAKDELRVCWSRHHNWK